MATVIRDLRSLRLFEILGAPMIAIVQAEAQAAQATAEYIESIGFETTKGADGKEVERLRTAKFRYSKLDANDEPAEFEIEVPLLAMVPIPGVQVKSAKVSLSVRVTDAAEEDSASGGARPPASGGTTGRPDFLRPKLLQLRGGIAPRQSGGGQQASRPGSYELDVEIEIERTPIAPGLEKILNMLEQGAAEREIPKAEDA